MFRLKTLLTVIGAVTVLVLAGNTVAFATTGHALILGKKNTANKITTLKRTTAGSALKIKTTSSSAAPLTVNGSGKVANLNADLVDGLDSTSLQNRVIRYTLPASTGAISYTWNLPGLPAGTYLATYSVYTNGTAAGQCWFIKPASSAFKLVSNGAPFATTFTYNASGVVNTSEVTQFHCTGGGAVFTVNTDPAGPTELTFTRIDALSSGVSAFRTAPGGARIAQ